MIDPSNGYEAVAAEFLAGRGRAPSSAIGARAVRDWARTLPSDATVIDLGCGSGLPITKVLVGEGLKVYAIDAAKSFVAAFRRNLPGIPIACESVEDSPFFDRMFDGVIAWGLMFLLLPEAQRRLIKRIGDMLVPGGRLLFTSCAGVEPLVWNDAMTGLESRSLGGVEYRTLLSAVGLTVTSEYEDEGENHYFDACKEGPGQAARRAPLPSRPPGPSSE
jgi:SAM-dependent methyltransferase